MRRDPRPRSAATSTSSAIRSANSAFPGEQIRVVEVHVDVRRQRAACATGGHAERVRRRQLEQASAVRQREPGGTVRRQSRRAMSEIRRAESGARAVGVAELRQDGGHVLVDVPAATAEEPRLEAVLAHPQRFAPDALGVLAATGRRPGVRGPDEVRVMAERPLLRGGACPLEPELCVLTGVGVRRPQQRRDRESRPAFPPEAGRTAASTRRREVVRRGTKQLRTVCSSCAASADS